MPSIYKHPAPKGKLWPPPAYAVTRHMMLLSRKHSWAPKRTPVVHPRRRPEAPAPVRLRRALGVGLRPSPGSSTGTMCGCLKDASSRISCSSLAWPRGTAPRRVARSRLRACARAHAGTLGAVPRWHGCMRGRCARKLLARASIPALRNRCCCEVPLAHSLSTYLRPYAFICGCYNIQHHAIPYHTILCHTVPYYSISPGRHRTGGPRRWSS